MTRTTVYLEETELRALKRLARERRTSEAALIREAISSLTRAAKRPLPRSLGAFHGGGRLATRAEELLAEGFGRDGIDR
jgi:hypothetical protein